MRLDVERVFWTPEPIWNGERCFILASGPSLTAEMVEKVRGRRSIVINSTYLMAPWADVLFFTDNGWFEPRRHVVADWPGMVVTVSRRAKGSLPDKVRRINAETRDDFPAPGSPTVRLGRSSGHTAISVAVAMGATSVVLLGYDMKLVDGHSHHHRDYARPEHPDVYRTEFLPSFDGWRSAAEARAVDVINATPGSALTEFRTAALDDLL